MALFLKFKRSRLRNGIYRLCVYRDRLFLYTVGQYNPKIGQIFIDLGRLTFYVSRGLLLRQQWKRAEYRDVVHGFLSGY